MAKMLNVYLHDELVGQLMLDEGQMVFAYSDDWLKNPNAMSLSQSLPLQKERFSRKICRGFFAGILPEESKRDMVARNLGISKENDFAMLEQIGGECAGAVSFIPEGKALPVRDYRYRSLSETKLEKILKLLPRQPLMAGEDGVRLSLAGAQDKIAVHVAGNKISLPLGGAPSTHILKPAIDRFEGLVFNEAFCLKLAKAMGLPVAKAQTGRVGTIDYLLVERYDRHVDADASIHRLHQEDFCQALGIASENKYQSEGGPGLKECFALLRAASSQPVIDLAHLLNAVIFNLLIGNHDAHGKNFSLLYHKQSTQLAPLYDLVSTIYYPELSKRMAMKLGGEAESTNITAQHLERFAQDVGLATPMVKKRALELTQRLLDAIDTVEAGFSEIDNSLAKVIRKRSRSLMSKFKNLSK